MPVAEIMLELLNFPVKNRSRLGGARKPLGRQVKMMRRWFLSPGLPLALATVGTFVLANSWISQNRELVRAYDDVSRLQRSQLVIEHDEIWRDQWLIALNQE